MGVMAMLVMTLRRGGGALSCRALVADWPSLPPKAVLNFTFHTAQRGLWKQVDRQGSMALTSLGVGEQYWQQQQPQPQHWRYRRSPVWQRREFATNSSSSGGGGSSSDGSSGNNSVLSNTTSYLRNLDNGAEIFLVGTAHVSRRSAEEVRDMVRLVRPDVVMVELCAERAARLRQGQPATEMDFFKDALSLLMPGGRGGGSGAGRAGGFGQQLFKLSMQGLYRFLKSLGMDPGGEFKVAIEEADRLGARVVYGDRGVQETLQRLAASLSFQDVLRMVSGAGMQPPSQALLDFFNGTTGATFESQVEAMKTRKMAREMSDFMRQANPQLAAALIDERDQIMVDNLRRLQGRVVGVVGLAHLDGIERRWQQLQQGGAGTVAKGY